MLIVRINRLLSAVILVSVFAAPAFAQPLGSSFTYQGVLKNGSSPANGLYDARFRLYDALAGGTQVGATLCLDNLGVINGLLTTSLDFGPQFNGAARYLEIEVRADSGLDCNTLAGFVILGPRQPLTATPYALHALNASISGTQGGAVSFTNAANTYAGSGALLGNLNAASISSGTLGGAHLAGAYSNALTLNNASNAFTGSFTGNGAALTNVDAQTLDGIDSSAFLQSIPSPLALTSTSVNGTIRGTNTSTAAGVSGVYGIASAGNLENYGVYGESTSGFGYGVRGVANSSNEQTPSAGVFGSSTGVGGLGVRGDAYGNLGIGVQGTVSDVNASAGVFGSVTATTGTASGVLGISEAASGRGVQGVVFGGTGSNYGVYGKSSSTAGVGTYGEAAATSGTTRGVYGVADSTSGRGVQGYATASTGTNYGVLGRTDSSTGYGVYGQTVPTTGTNYAVFASGNSGASGTKSFRIDHPSDPANKYLLHYSAESDEVINFYSGKVTLDGAGEAIVDLPAYFALINKDPRYTLTAIGAAMPNLHVALEIDETSLALGASAEPGQAAPPCWFKIAGGVPHAKVSWRVDAVRNDRWMRTHGAPVEIDKQGEERGTYQHPELFGQSAELGMDRATPRPTDVAGDR